MSIGLMPTCSVQGNGITARRPSRNAGVGTQSERNRNAIGTQSGRGHASDFRDIEYQLARKSSVETLTKNFGVSTLSLKIRLIINWLPY